MIVHMRHNLKGRPVCYRDDTPFVPSAMMDNNIDNITCVDCLRDLAKAAVIYGNARRAMRNK